MSQRVKITVALGAGCGLRQGEMFGLSPEDIDRDTKVIHVVRQVQQTSNKLIFCRPKREKLRDVPVSDQVLRELDDYMALFPPVDITLPWKESDGEPTTVNLIMADSENRAWWRQTFNSEMWQPALKRA